MFWFRVKLSFDCGHRKGQVTVVIKSLPHIDLEVIAGQSRHFRVFIKGQAWISQFENF